MTDDLDDLLGGGPEPKQRPSERRNERLAAQQRLLSRERVQYSDDEHEAFAQVLEEGGTPSVQTLKRPITLTNLATIIEKEPRRTAGLLRNCPTAGTVKTGKYAGQPMYDLKEAINYLAPPKAKDISSWVKAQSSASLPPFFHKAFWEGEDKRMTVLEKAGDLWRTDDVQRILGETAITIKDAMLLWVEKLPGVQQMTTEQYNSFREQVNALQEEIYRICVTQPEEKRQKRLRSYQGEIEAIVDEMVGTPVDDE